MSQAGTFVSEPEIQKKPSEGTSFERLSPRKVNMSYGAPSGTRTRDTLIKSQGASRQARQ